MELGLIIFTDVKGDRQSFLGMAVCLNWE